LLGGGLGILVVAFAKYIYKEYTMENNFEKYKFESLLARFKVLYILMLDISEKHYG